MLGWWKKDLIIHATNELQYIQARIQLEIWLSLGNVTSSFVTSHNAQFVTSYDIAVSIMFS